MTQKWKGETRTKETECSTQKKEKKPKYVEERKTKVKKDMMMATGY